MYAQLKADTIKNQRRNKNFHLMTVMGAPPGALASKPLTKARGAAASWDAALTTASTCPLSTPR